MEKRLDLLLLVPPGGHYAERWSGSISMPPLGLAYLAGSARKAGFSVELIDARAQRIGIGALAGLARQKRPRTVGITCVTETRFSARDTVRAVRQALPESWIVLGGPHPSAADLDLLQHLPEADAVIRGEGERPLVQALHCLGEPRPDLAAVPALTWRSPGGDLVRNKPLALPGRNLDGLPGPAWDLLPWQAYGFRLEVPGQGWLRAANMMTSRGCPWTCPFCMTPALSGTRIRVNSDDWIIDEMLALRERFGMQAIWFFDDLFAFQKKRVRDFCLRLLERGLMMPWFCEIRVDSVDRELLVLMRQAGCFKVGFGIESGDPEILARMGKGITLQEAREVIGWCEELGLLSHAFFILGHPGETFEQAGRTLDLIEQLPPGCEPSLSLMRIYPGTPLEAQARAEGVLPASFSWSQERRSRDLGLSAAQGNVPLYLGALTWPQVGQLLARWSRARRQPPWGRAWRVLRSIRSLGDARRVLALAQGYWSARGGSVPQGCAQ